MKGAGILRDVIYIYEWTALESGVALLMNAMAGGTAISVTVDLWKRSILVVYSTGKDSR